MIVCDCCKAEDGHEIIIVLDDVPMLEDLPGPQKIMLCAQCVALAMRPAGPATR